MTSLRQTSTPINVYSRSTDMEVDPVSPARIQDTPRTSNCGQRSKLLDLIPRRRLKSECNRTSLDEDLGHPPICSPPPEMFVDFAKSAPDDTFWGDRFRARSQTDSGNFIHSGQRGLTICHKRPSGVLVIFPPSSACSPKASNSSSIDGMISPLSPLTHGAAPVAARSHVHAHSCDGSGSAGSPRDGYTRSSPRRPLFVDTQLANGQKRSPVGSMMDFMRGRNRTTSLTMNGSTSGPNTPCSPQPVSARGSTSTDNGYPLSPLFSPGGRPMLSSSYRNAYRSLDSDSGLGLNSPSIGQTALLIKEVCLES